MTKNQSKIEIKQHCITEFLKKSICTRTTFTIKKVGESSTNKGNTSRTMHWQYVYKRSRFSTEGITNLTHYSVLPGGKFYQDLFV